MKKLLFVMVLAVSMAACKTQFATSAGAYLQQHCVDCKVVKLPNEKYRISGRLTGIYDTTEVAKYIDEGKITFDIRKAEISMVVVSADSILPAQKILSAIGRGISKGTKK